MVTLFERLFLAALLTCTCGYTSALAATGSHLQDALHPISTHQHWRYLLQDVAQPAAKVADASSALPSNHTRDSAAKTPVAASRSAVAATASSGISATKTKGAEVQQDPHTADAKSQDTGATGPAGKPETSSNDNARNHQQQQTTRAAVVPAVDSNSTSDTAGNSPSTPAGSSNSEASSPGSGQPQEQVATTRSSPAAASSNTTAPGHTTAGAAREPPQSPEEAELQSVVDAEVEAEVTDVTTNNINDKLSDADAKEIQVNSTGHPSTAPDSSNTVNERVEAEVEAEVENEQAETARAAGAANRVGVEGEGKAATPAATASAEGTAEDQKLGGSQVNISDIRNSTSNGSSPLLTDSTVPTAAPTIQPVSLGSTASSSTNDDSSNRGSAAESVQEEAAAAAVSSDEAAAAAAAGYGPKVSEDSHDSSSSSSGGGGSAVNTTALSSSSTSATSAVGAGGSPAVTSQQQQQQQPSDGDSSSKDADVRRESQQSPIHHHHNAHTRHHFPAAAVTAAEPSATTSAATDSSPSPSSSSGSDGIASVSAAGDNVPAGDKSAVAAVAEQHYNIIIPPPAAEVYVSSDVASAAGQQQQQQDAEYTDKQQLQWQHTQAGQPADDKIDYIAKLQQQQDEQLRMEDRLHAAQHQVSDSRAGFNADEAATAGVPSWDMGSQAYNLHNVHRAAKLGASLLAVTIIVGAVVLSYNTFSRRSRHIAGGRVGLPYHSIHPPGGPPTTNGSKSSNSSSSSNSSPRTARGTGGWNVGSKNTAGDGALAGDGRQQYGGAAFRLHSSKGLLGAAAAASNSLSGAIGLGVRSHGVYGSNSSTDMHGWDSAGDDWNDGWDDIETGLDNSVSDNVHDANTDEAVGTASGLGSDHRSDLVLRSNGQVVGSGTISPRRSQPAARQRSPNRVQAGNGMGDVLRSGDHGWMGRQQSGGSDFEQW